MSAQFPEGTKIIYDNEYKGEVRKATLDKALGSYLYKVVLDQKGSTTTTTSPSSPLTTQVTWTKIPTVTKDNVSGLNLKLASS